MSTAFLFELIQFAAIAVLFALFVYSKMQKPSEMQKYVSMLALNMMLMLLGYIVEMEAPEIWSSYCGTIISYIGSPFLTASMFLFVCTFYGKKVPKWAFITMMCYALLITTIVFTNPLHHLYYSSVTYDENAAFSPLVLVHGPLYWVNLAQIIFYNIAVFTTVITGYIKKSLSPLKRRLSIYALLMLLSTISGFVLYFIGVGGGYDTTMFGLTAATIFMSILFFRCRIFDVVDMAKDYALDISSDGLLIFDDTKKLVYKNAAASDAIGKAIPKKYIDELSDGTSVYKQNDTVYSINTNTIKRRGEYLGKSVEIHDITESYTYSERLESAVNEATEKLEKIQRTIFGSFASLVEARSIETGDHIQRVSRYTEIITDELIASDKHTDILTEEYKNILIHSAPLHDVGKISIPDAILLKPGRLTPEEFEQMKKHSALGAEIIKSIMGGLESEKYVKMAAEIALYHHERWDGTGYPTGIKGNEIPLSARIVAVADCYDAMTSERCYKEAFPDSKALGILKEESGTHFDPDIVEAFINSKQKMN